MIGAGIAGAAVARDLALRGDDVVLLDGSAPGRGATGRNAGFLLAESACFATEADRHGPLVAADLRAAGLRTRALVHDLAARHAGIALATPGSVRLATDPAEVRDFGLSARAGLDRVRTEPLANVPERGSGAFLDPALVDEGDGVLDPLGLLAALLGDGEAAGVRRFDATPVARLAAGADGVTVATPEGEVRAERVVLAVNAEVRRVLGFGTRRVRPVRAQALAARLEPAPAWQRPTYANQGGDYWRLLPDGSVLLGGLRRHAGRGENTRSDAPTARIQGELDRLLRRLAGPDATIDVTHRWAGTMGFTRDGLPQVGALRENPRVQLLAGFNGHGIGWAPALAHELAAHLTDAGPPPPARLAPR